MQELGSQYVLKPTQECHIGCLQDQVKTVKIFQIELTSEQEYPASLIPGEWFELLKMVRGTDDEKKRQAATGLAI